MLCRERSRQPDDTHPPSGLRIALLEYCPFQQAAFCLDALQRRAVHDELDGVEKAMQRPLVDRFRTRWYR